MLLVASWMLGSGDASVAVLGERPSLETAAAPRVEPKPAHRIEAGPAQTIDPKAELKSPEPLAIPAAMQEAAPTAPQITQSATVPNKPAENPPAGSAAIPTRPAEPQQARPAAIPTPPIKPADIRPIEPEPADSKAAESKPARSAPAESKPLQSKIVEAKPTAAAPAEANSADLKMEIEEPKPGEIKRTASRPARSPASSTPATEPEASKLRGLSQSMDYGPPPPDITGSINTASKPTTPRTRARTSGTAAAGQLQIVDPFTQFFRDLETLQRQSQAR
jgi:hypothetical protein